MEALLKKRRSLSSQIKLLEFFMSDPDSLTAEHVQEYNNQAVDLHKENVELHDLISVKSSDEQYEQYEQQFFDLAERISKMKVSLGVLMTRQLDVTAALNRSMPVLFPHSSSLRTGTEVRLPRLDPPVFSGDLCTWLSFHDLFKALIHDNPILTGAQKLQYLKASLKGEPALLIQSIQISDANYIEAWELLLARYECKRELIRVQLERLMSQPSLLVMSAEALRKLLDTTSECVRSLEVMKLTREELFDLMVVHLISQKLDAESRLQWERSLGESKLPTLKSFLTFLDHHARVTAVVAAANVPFKKKPALMLKNAIAVSPGITTLLCEVCQGEHAVFRCEEFLKMSVQQRMDATKRLRLCFNCLRRGHCAQKCSASRCRKCHKHHHTLIHIAESLNTTEPQGVVVASQMVGASRTFPQVLLATALLRVQGTCGQSFVCRAFLDNGSQGSFITEHCVQGLALPRSRIRASVSGMASIGVGTVRSCVQLVFTSLHGKETFEVTALVLSKIANLLPNNPVDERACAHLKGLCLADSYFFKPGQVDILLGADVYGQLVRPGYCSGGVGLPIGLETALGWVVLGPVAGGFSGPASCQRVAIHHATVDTDAILQRFWKVENVPQTCVQTEEERRCEEHFTKTYSRDPTGRFVVRLPFRPDAKELGDSRSIALRRFNQLERRLSRDEALRTSYVQFMNEYEQLGHMSVVSTQLRPVSPEMSFYLPHHPVIKASSVTTKVRVVFDALSRSAAGVSLNEKLMVGPKLQEDLFTLLVRFRTHVVAFVADIEKMYRQIKMHYTDVNFQRILWRQSPDLPICDYQLETVTYGTASAPYQAVKCVQQLASLNQESFPEAALVTMRDFYLDDLMSGAPSVRKALQLQGQVSALLKNGGFQLRKWTSNSREVIMAVPEEHRGTQDPFTLEEDEVVKILGLQWHPALDCFSFSLSSMEDGIPTKRTVLSNLARVFDPLGWLSPVTIQAKIMFQELWKCNLDWDSPLPDEKCERWNKYRQDLKKSESTRIDRCLVSVDSCDHLLCGFCDASERAYAAITYLLTTTVCGEVKVVLIAAKTKVAPVKPMSLPRLELCAAVLLVKLMTSVKKSLCLEVKSSLCWSDSTIVLAWLASPAYRWKTFIANRVTLIQECGFKWCHVAGEENPADCASRGITAEELNCHELWWNGPQWLRQNPLINCGFVGDTKLEERALRECFVATIDLSLIDRFSSLTTLQRVVAYVLRFIENAKLSSDSRKRGLLTVLELESALMKLVRLVQLAEFPLEMQCAEQGKVLPAKSKLLNLNPFCDKAALLRVGGRLSQARLTFEAKHPVILPRRNTLTKKIVLREHLRLLHAGPQLLLASLNQRFWILCGRDVVRQVVRKCLVCHRQRVQVTSQLMADLPSSRVLPYASVFTSTGVDFAGPVTLRVLRGRGQKCFKGYISVFVCFATRAMHLELVSDLTSSAFIAALKRFIARRGKPAHIHSDCGTNFVGARKQLDELMRITREVQSSEPVLRYLSEEGVQWHFNPPGTPHFGGLWEAGVKSVKHHLKRVVGSVMLNFEDMTTVLAQIEACLNSRPLTQLSSDPSDLLPLTPGHFLIGRAMTAFPEPDFTTVPANRLSRWQLLQKLVQDFWRRWQIEYLSRLQQRPKWVTKKTNLKVGDLVLLKKENLAPLHWKLGRVLELHPGPDHLVRVVTLKTEDGQCRCPIVKIVPLPLED